MLARIKAVVVRPRVPATVDDSIKQRTADRVRIVAERVQALEIEAQSFRQRRQP